jgi:YD repeat-containing protein
VSAAVLVYEDWALDHAGSTLVLVLNAGELVEGLPEGQYAWHYTYDPLGRLTYACAAWTGSACASDEWTYTYDGAGNLLTFSRWDAAGEQVETLGFVYNGANQLACVDGNANQQCGDPEDVAYTYDAYGSLLDDGANTYTYDAALRLTSVSDGVTTTTYTYNGDGDRVAQTVDDGVNPAVTTAYILDTAAPLTMVLAETTGPDTIYYLHGLGLVAQSDGTQTEYFAYDGLGSVRQVTDATGGVLLAQTFDPYGNAYARALDAAWTGGTRFGYTGEYTAGGPLLPARHVGRRQQQAAVA